MNPTTGQSAMQLVALALVMATAVLQGQPCPRGQVWDETKGRCALCGLGTVKSPDTDGADAATCQYARDVCGTAEVAKWGSCTRCPSKQVAVDDVMCGPCPPGTIWTSAVTGTDALCHQDIAPSCTVEVCNGKDDDCDGHVDEGLGIYTCGIGYCARTVPRCLDGQTQTCKPGKPRQETCNGIDDDCNGVVDDIPDEIFCTPCNTKAPACKDGKRNNCAYVCSQPCCEDCWRYTDPTEHDWCTSSCQDCANSDKCLGYADDVAEAVAELMCEQAANACGISLSAFSNGRQVNRQQCYYLAYDQCMSHGLAHAQTDEISLCRLYATGGGTCSATQFRSVFKALLEDMCSNESAQIAYQRAP